MFFLFVAGCIKNGSEFNRKPILEFNTAIDDYQFENKDILPVRKGLLYQSFCVYNFDLSVTQECLILLGEIENKAYNF